MSEPEPEALFTPTNSLSIALKDHAAMTRHIKSFALPTRFTFIFNDTDLIQGSKVASYLLSCDTDAARWNLREPLILATNGGFVGLPNDQLMRFNPNDFEAHMFKFLDEYCSVSEVAAKLDLCFRKLDPAWLGKTVIKLMHQGGELESIDRFVFGDLTDMADLEPFVRDFGGANISLIMLGSLPQMPNFLQKVKFIWLPPHGPVEKTLDWLDRELNILSQSQASA